MLGWTGANPYTWISSVPKGPKRTSCGKRNEHFVPDAQSTAVPLRVLTLSLVALTAAVVAALFSPEDLLEQKILAGVLALIQRLLAGYQSVR